MNIESHGSRPTGICRLCFFAVISLFATAARAIDADGDGIDSAWESTYSGAPAYMSDSDSTDAWEDPDGDLLNNLGEAQSATNPGIMDTDDDGLNDTYNYGLEAWWKFSETAGSPASSANAVSGGPSLTLNGATIVTGGLLGNALKPVYYTNNVQASAVVLSNCMEWGFSGWFKMDSVSTSNVIFAAKASQSSTNIIGAHVSGTSWGAMTLYVTLNGLTYSAAVNVAQGSNFHHLAVSRDQVTNRVDVYFDGALLTAAPVTSSPEPLSLASGQFKVGTIYVTGGGGYTNWFYGSLEDVRLYKRRLLATEVDALYNNGCISTNAAKYWTISYLLNNPLGQIDSDGDGFTNLAEAIAGSDPNLNTSTPVPANTGYQLHTKLG